MDKTTFRHPLSIAALDDRNFRAFVRSDDGNVEHYWSDIDQQTMFGPEDLGGRFDSDPIAVRRFTGSGEVLHLIGRSGMELVDWFWQSGRNLLLGQPTLRKLPAFSLADPEVVVTDGTTIHVFAPSLDGPMRHWLLESEEDGWSGQQVLSEHKADHDIRPCAVVRESGTLDLFSVDRDTTGLRRWFLDAQGWRSQDLSQSADGKKLVGRPTAVSFAPDRLDVFAVRRDGVPVHWGWDGQHWFGPELRLRDARLLPDDLQLLSTGEKQLTLMARQLDSAGQPQLVSWDLVPQFGTWDGPDSSGSSPFPAAARITTFADSTALSDKEFGRMSIVSRSADGSFTVDRSVLSVENEIDQVPRWQDEDSITLNRDEPAPPPAGFTPATTDAVLVARRPEDLLLLGVHWSDTVNVEPGPPLELVAQAGAELTVTFPPQHVAEEVVHGEGAFQPPSPSAATGGVPVWRASIAGPSQVVVVFDEAVRVPLTVDGVLTALRQGRLVPAADLTDANTQLELPTGLLMTPFRADDAKVVLDHPTGAVLGPEGTVGLWSSRVAATGVAPAEPAGLSLRALGAELTDSFPTSLRGGSRARILAEEPTARIDRLRLSALGATFSAAGSWPTYSWDHHATLGRDQKVRTATQGVLYPFGHRAVHVESSERVLVDTEQGAIAHLVNTSVLEITEPVKDLAPSRAFPFTRVEIQRTLVELGGDPVFEKHPFPHPTAEVFTDPLSFVSFGEIGKIILLTNQLQQVIPARQPGEPLVEDFAHLLVNATDEQNDAADNYLVGWLEIKRKRALLAALEAGASAEVDLFMIPRQGNRPIQFPVVLSGPSSQVHVEMPVVFVADIRLEEGHLHPAYKSLEDSDDLQRVEAAYNDLEVGGGDVAVGPVRIDMVGAAEPKPPDSPEVRRLHIVGEPREGGFVPRLGTAPVAGEAKPPAERWAFEMAMTEVATLVGHPVSDGPPLLRVALSPELLSGAPDPGLLFVAPEGVAALAAEFSLNSARSGGLAAPDLTIDGVSRSQGPVQAETFLAQVQQADLDPKKFLGEAANLMGFSLADLVDGSSLPRAPEILSDVESGRPPRVTLVWRDVPLKTDEGLLVTSDDSRLTIDVTLAPDAQKVMCTVKDITLVFPERDEDSKLLEVHLEEVVFVQEGGAVPTLRVQGVTTRFSGFLKLLEKLQDAVKLDGASPAIHASDKGVTATFDLPIPDVPTGGFQLTGLTFHSMIDVPFDRRPVSIELAFASREDPFNVSILGLGGGGYVDIALDSGGLKRLEIALEFGASLEVNFFVATGEVHVMGGIRVVHENGFELAGYLRMGGMVEVLGLVSVSVELVVTLAYVEHSDDPPVDNAMIGRATLVLELDLLLFSESVELDTGPWIIAGDTPATDRSPLPPGLVLEPEPLIDPVLGVRRLPAGLGGVSLPFTGIDAEAWRSYRAVFDEAALPEVAVP